MNEEKFAYQNLCHISDDLETSCKHAKEQLFFLLSKELPLDRHFAICVHQDVKLSERYQKMYEIYTYADIKEVNSQNITFNHCSFGPPLLTNMTLWGKIKKQSKKLLRFLVLKGIK